jgi:hypothetical protein
VLSEQKTIEHKNTFVVDVRALALQQGPIAATGRVSGKRSTLWRGMIHYALRLDGVSYAVPYDAWFINIAEGSQVTFLHAPGHTAAFRPEDRDFGPAGLLTLLSAGPLLLLILAMSLSGAIDLYSSVKRLRAA